MGKVAMVLVRLDGLDDIKNDLDFGKNLGAAIDRFKRSNQSQHERQIHVPGSGNVAEVASLEHSDHEHLIRVVGNTSHKITSNDEIKEYLSRRQR